MGKIYTRGTKQADYIAQYARRYDTVEIDATFYGIPRQSTVEGWRDRTPASFLFSAKAPQSITHEKFLVDCDRDLSEFLKTMDTIGPRLGPIVFQFPYFSKKYNVTEKGFLDRLTPFVRSLPTDGHLFVIEVRNKAWLRAPLCDLLANHGIALALIDHPWMHPSSHLMAIDGILAGPFAYIRLLGDRYGIEKITTYWGEHAVDRKPDLQRWATVMKSILTQRLNVFGYVNSHYSGYAPGDVDTLYEMLGRSAPLQQKT